MTDATSPPSRALRVARACLLLAVFAVFGPGLLGDFVWDDVRLIKTNVYVRDLSRLGEALTHDFWYTPALRERATGLAQQYYRPVVTAAYALEFRAFGERPLGYHAVNLALHAACTLLLFGWLRRRLRAESPRAVVAAALAAGLFALHPSRPESVTWISGSTDLWMTLWILLGLHVHDRRDDTLGTLGASLLFALAFFSKEAAIVAPALLASDALLLTDDPVRRRRGLARALVALLVLCAALALRVSIVPLGTTGQAAEGFPRAALRVLSSFGHYLARTFAPVPPSVQTATLVYDARGLPVYAPWSVALGALGALGFLAMTWKAWRDPRWRPWLADALWFPIALAPMLNILPLRSNVLIAERFLYLPLVGAAALLARGILALESLPSPRRALLGASAAALLACGLASVEHVGHFITAEDLWLHEARVNPDSHYALNQLAYLRIEQGRSGEAVALMSRAHAAALRTGNHREAVMIALRTVQTLLWSTPDEDQATLRAIRDFLDAFETRSDGVASLSTREVRFALPLRAFPPGARAQFGLATARAHAWLRTYEPAEAERQLRAILRANPTAFTARHHLAVALADQERWDEALATLREQFAMIPANAPDVALFEALQRHRARVQQADGETAALMRARGALLVELGHHKRAREVLGPHVEAHPEDVESQMLLVRVDVEDRFYARARERLRRAMERDPRNAPQYADALTRIPGP